MFQAQVTLLLLLFVSGVMPMAIHADLRSTAYYQTAKNRLIADLKWIKERAPDVISGGDFECDESSDPQKDDHGEKTAEIFLTKLADSCKDDMECGARMGRLTTAVNQRDIFAVAVSQRLAEIACISHLIHKFDPSDADRFRQVLPKPYPYSVAGLHFKGEYRERLEPMLDADFKSLEAQAMTYFARVATSDYEFTVLPVHDFEASSFAEALTDFLINRAGQEVVHGMVRQISRDASSRSQFETFIPRTILFLKRAQTMVTEIATLVPALRSVVAADIRTLPDRLVEYGTGEGGGGDPQVRRVHGVLELVRNGLSPTIALERLSNGTGDGDCGPLELLGRVAGEWNNSVLPDGKRTIGGLDRYAVQQFGKEFLGHLFGNEFLKCYDRALRDRAHSSEEWTVAAETVTALLLRMEQMHRLVTDSENRLAKSAGDDAEQPQLDGLRPEDVLSPLVETIKFALTSMEVTNTDGDHVGDLLPIWMEVYHAAAAERYVDAVSAALRYVHMRQEPNKQEGTRGDMAVVRLITLGANLVEADTPEEFHAAFYTAAAPVGSSVVKLEPAPRITIGAYVGASVGAEQRRDSYAWDMHAGTVLPVGIELTFLSSFDKHQNPCCPVGLFVSPIDLGVIANYRFNGLFNAEEAPEDDSAQLEPPIIGLEQLFAPSAYLVFGLNSDFPLTLGFGFQYAPRARGNGSDEADQTDVFRASLVLAIDVTLLRL